MTSFQLRNFAGGAKIIKMPLDQTDFDICVVGGLNATALVKFWQNDHLKQTMAIVSERSKFVNPTLYYLCSYGYVKELKLEAASVGAQVNAASRVNVNTRVSKFLPDENKIQLANGKEYTYKALVLAPGFEHKSESIEGLKEMEDEGHTSGVFCHIVDERKRMNRNFHHGHNHYHGDMIVYQPQFPFKDEGISFFTFFYEHQMRYEQLWGRAADNAKIQFWTPNSSIFEFEYANKVALEECEKRGIEVFFGQELIKVKKNAIGERFGVFRNVETGEIFEKAFNQLIVNPTAKPQPEIAESPFVDENGLIDVNPYTLQHKTYENVFAFGSAANLPTTRSQYATMAQSPIVKHNVIQYLEGKELNAIYDGYAFVGLFLGTRYMTSFQHFYNGEPHPKNHLAPHYGLFSRIYFNRYQASAVKLANQYSNFK